MMKNHGFGGILSAVVPPLVVSTFVQIVNMPLIRSTITLQVSWSHLLPFHPLNLAMTESCKSTAECSCLYVQSLFYQGHLLSMARHFCRSPFEFFCHFFMFPKES
jgi:hypothetical protein